jgi:4-amino-4-deoxy-L-arabinose transferase-like glycosyltransferase
MRNIPWIAAWAVFAIHAATNAGYGFFRDELYFIVCGLHPQLGYVDQPPVVPLLSGLTQIFGHSLFLLRLIPALFAAGGVYVTCLLVAEFGGGAFAQALAAIVYFFTGVLMSFGMKMSPDTVGLLTWPLLALIAVRIVKGADSRLWLLAGVVAGISLESKYSVLFFLAALILGLLATRERRVLFDRWFVAGAAIALAIALPNFWWQAHYGFPMLELLRAGQNGKNIIVGPLTYLFQEIVITGIFLWPAWVIGLIWLLRTAPYRFLGYAYVVLILEMLLFHGKHYYPADVYPILIAAGAVPIEAWTRNRNALRLAVMTFAVVAGTVFVPFALPVLPEAAFVRYQDAIGSTLHITEKTIATEHDRETSALPGDWADMHGWSQMAGAVSRVYNALTPSERARAVVFAGNYGEASAVQFFAPGIPVISEHNQYWLWGTRGYDGSVIVQVNGSCFHSDKLFASRTLGARFKDRWAISYERDIPIWVCRGIKRPLSQVWPSIKTYE